MHTSIDHYAASHEEVHHINPNLSSISRNMHNQSYTNEDIFQRDKNFKKFKRMKDILKIASHGALPTSVIGDIAMPDHGNVWNFNYFDNKFAINAFDLILIDVPSCLTIDSQRSIKAKFHEFIYTDVDGTLQLTGNLNTLVRSNIPIVIYANI